MTLALVVLLFLQGSPANTQAYADAVMVPWSDGSVSPMNAWSLASSFTDANGNPLYPNATPGAIISLPLTVGAPWQ